MKWLLLFWLLSSACAPRQALASASLLVEQPFGHFGGMNPTGHAAVYFDHICAETPTRLRPCAPGERGAVVSRYHRVGGYDWLAIPVLPYLYAVDSVEDIPSMATPEIEVALRESYRKAHLREIQPDDPLQPTPDGEWVQLAGSAFDRTIHGFTVATTSAQDARFVAQFNDRRNVSHFNLLFNNCADLARAILNFYYPHAIHRDFIADLGFTTPKHEAKDLVKYDRRHPAMELSFFVIPQVAGTIDRSTPVRGVAESLVRSKRYVLPLGYFQPHLTGGLALAYLGRGRFRFPENVPIRRAESFAPQVPSETRPVAAPQSSELAVAAPVPATELGPFPTEDAGTVESAPDPVVSTPAQAAN